MRIVLFGFMIGTMTTSPAAAHNSAVVTRDTFWDSWNIEPLIVIPLLVALWLYGLGLSRLWRRAGLGHGVVYFRSLSFLLGVCAILAALVSPLESLSGVMLSAHMMQHAILLVVAPLLIVFAKPGLVITWALPEGWRKDCLGSPTWRFLIASGNAFSKPLPAASIHGISLWFWHAPAAFDAAVANDLLHAVEHATFFGTALLFWRAIVDCSSQRAGPALAASFATLIHGGLLGALITLAPLPLYAWYRSGALLWGLSALEDQQLAGLLMWVPMGIVYLGACLVLASQFVIDKQERGCDVIRVTACDSSDTARGNPTALSSKLH